jgi:hypothetical protein
MLCRGNVFADTLPALLVLKNKRRLSYKITLLPVVNLVSPESLNSGALKEGRYNTT